MGKAFRKPIPAPPNWYWINVDGCYCCKNKNDCGGCKRLKAFHAQELAKQKRQKKKELRQYVYREE